MSPHYRHSHAATYYRSALLLGLVRGAAVHDWAHQVIDEGDDPPQAFFEIVSVPADDLSALRSALWPLVVDPEPADVLAAIFGLLHEDLAAGRRPYSDTLTIVRQMRSILRLPPDIYAALNAALVAQAADPQGTALASWLRGFA
jgi:hypothetical protein